MPPLVSKKGASSLFINDSRVHHPLITMKTPLKLTFVFALLLSGGTTVRADVQDLAAIAHYADQLLNQGVRGGRFVELVDQRYYQVYPDYGPGMGTYVQGLHDQGLRGRALADAIHLEQQRRGIPPGQLKKATGIPPGQLKKATGIPPGQMKKMNVVPEPGFFPPGKVKPKDKFDGGKGNGNSNGNGNGKGKGKDK